MYQYPLFETLSIINGKFSNLYYHQQRVNYAFSYFFKAECHLNLTDINIPNKFKKGTIRCRINYNKSSYEVNFYPYTPKIIKKFKLVYTQDLDYQFKYSERNQLDSLKNTECDEIIIINNGFVSDCTIGNLIFLKNQQWYSSCNYLLKGTQLSYLLDQQKIKLKEITADDLWDYE